MFYLFFSGFTIPQLKDGGCRSVQDLVESDRCFPLLVCILNFLNPYDAFKLVALHRFGAKEGVIATTYFQ